MRRRFSPASKLFAVLAVACGLAAFALVRGYAARLEALRPVAGSPVRVVVATGDLTRGTLLTASMLRETTMPSAFAPPGVVSSAGDAQGRTLASDLAEGEVLTRTRLGVQGAGPVASLVPPGLRAFTVPGSLPAGAVRPGDRVDVLATFGGGRPHTETVATGLEVLLVLDGGGAGGATTIPASGGAVGSGQSLVLLVSPDQAERLAYARAFADLAVSIAGREEVVPAPGSVPATPGSP